MGPPAFPPLPPPFPWWLLARGVAPDDKRDRTPQEWLVDLIWEWDLRAATVARFIAENCDP